ncbi:hypothetical protein [Pyrobaculum neutrophilum]|uniref:Uncharacterized protein n=1 Tax=Pyrobaculum neutrophilum (strain DSM 2338 / JCM 9278 / NBRC 100436 / V24Sta) TaxID=444157 RepID=B1YC86_PYRNV|nr:hypothetical protein [Pyrobaculum neutrophilum]ACB39399.1 conserved hypothetical protein [Pyrobaculum neutrophilum V24Sta]
MKALRDFLFGLLFLDLYHETAKLNRQLNLLMSILLFGDFLGVPLLTSYYSLRLLPYAYPALSEFRKEAVKEHEIFDLLSEYHVH